MKNNQKITSSLIDIFISLFKVIIFLLFLPYLFFIGAFRKRNRDKFYIKGMNTEYELSCPVCGFTDKYMVGTAHTFEEPRVFYSLTIAYCPKCKEPIPTTIGLEDKDKKFCSSCGSKLLFFKFDSKQKLRCPKCLSRKLKVTDLERPWMT